MEQLSEVKHTQTTNQLRRLHENESTWISSGVFSLASNEKLWVLQTIVTEKCFA